MQYQKSSKKNDMKNLIKISLGLFAIIAFSSCEDFLDKEPIDEIGEGDFYSSTEELNMATMACYGGLKNTLQYEWELTEIRSDNARLWLTGSSSTDNRALMMLDNYTVESTHTNNRLYWEAAFKNIDNCNRVINYINNVSDSTLALQYEGEARFIRAYIYFNLVRLYGPMFIVDKLYSPEEVNVLERSSVEDTYAFIYDDLNKAIEYLPETYSEDELGRATSWAAKTLLAKVYLTNHNTDMAKDLLLDVKDNGPFALESSYANVFSTQNEMNDEIIFSARYKSGGFGLGSPFANYFAPDKAESVISFGGKGFNAPTEDLMNGYADNDKRKDVVFSPTWSSNGGVSVTYAAWVTKYYSQVAIEFDAENDWPILRYADVLLMLAEVDETNRLAYLNEVRLRAGVTEYTNADFASEREWAIAIENERRLEFAFENQRFFDLLRTGRLYDVMRMHYETEGIKDEVTAEVTPYYTDPSLMTYLSKRALDDWQFLLPVPLSVLNTAVNATQNPGY